MARWTRFIARNKGRVILVWVLVVVAAGAASAGLGGLLTNRFSVPGSDAEKGFALLKDHFGAKGDGFLLVVQVPRGRENDLSIGAALQRATDRGAAAIRGGKAGPVQEAAPRILISTISTPLDNNVASDRTPAVRRAVGTIPGVRLYLTGGPAINHDTQPLYNEDLVKGETIALPIALFVLAFMLGTLGGIVVPLVFALVTIPTTLGFVWIFAHVLDMATYVQNIVTLIGLAIAIDYSMLVVFRFREEMRTHEDTTEALVATMATAGRATMFSGLAVALGLSLLVFMPVPFMQSMGVGGLLVPLVSLAAAVTFLPAFLAVLGRGVNRFRVVPRRVLERRAEATGGFWGRLAHSIMRRPVPYLAGATLVMLALALPATGLQLTGGDTRGYPATTEATKGLKVIKDSVGTGVLSPNEIVIDTGRPAGAWSKSSLDAQRALAGQLQGDPEVDTASVAAPGTFVSHPGPPGPAAAAAARRANLVDATGRYVQVRAGGRSDSGTQAAKDLVGRIRNDYLPSAGLHADVWVTGAPAFSVDFIDAILGAFPWLIAAVCLLTYLLLARAFRSIVLPAKAVAMNLLSVGASFGVLVLAFQHGWGKAIGFQESPQIEAWIPVFLFAMLFGLSMDYEVFLLSRMREEWDRRHDNEAAIVGGLEHTGRIITAAALIMIAAFSGFTAGRFVGLQMFGLGLSAAIFLDATIVRALLVPAAMKLIGKWNWWLPEWAARWLRVAPSPLLPAPAGADGRPATVDEVNRALAERSKDFPRPAERPRAPRP